MVDLNKLLEGTGAAGVTGATFYYLARAWYEAAKRRNGGAPKTLADVVQALARQSEENRAAHIAHEEENRRCHERHAELIASQTAALERFGASIARLLGRTDPRT